MVVVDDFICGEQAGSGVVLVIIGFYRSVENINLQVFG